MVVVLLPKAEGGFRPIGLIPNTPRIWTRVRRIEAKAWEISCDRKYLYAGAGRGATVAAWKQAARAEVAAAGGVCRGRHTGCGGQGCRHATALLLT